MFLKSGSFYAVSTSDLPRKYNSYFCFSLQTFDSVSESKNARVPMSYCQLKWRMSSHASLSWYHMLELNVIVVEYFSNSCLYYYNVVKQLNTLFRFKKVKNLDNTKRRSI